MNRIRLHDMPLTSAQLKRIRALPSGTNRVRAARQSLELTQVQLAEEIGLTQSALSDLERRRYDATTVETARRFAIFFGCSIEDLFPADAAKVAS